jgi:uncharacterized tellurite resistance protein B-like protein
MSLFKLLGLTSETDRNTNVADKSDTKTIRRIASKLETLPKERALYLAAFAYLLARAANADSFVSLEETQKIKEIIQDLGHLPEAQAILVAEIAKNQVNLFGGTEDFLVSRRFKEIASTEQCLELLECVIAVSAVDKSITVPEENQARQISKELGITHEQFVAARVVYKNYFETIKGLQKKLK